MLKRYIKNKKPITVIVGHYGSGKSEVISNLAISAENQKKFLYDLDIINPYFRNNIIKNKLEKNNVKYISGTVEGLNGDLPSIPNISLNEGERIFIDLGGDEVGVKVLKGYKDKIFPKNLCEFYMVVNTNRPETKDITGIKGYIEKIENELGEKIDGIISNTHMLNYTTEMDIENGYSIVKKVCSELNKELICITYPKAIVDIDKLKNFEGYDLLYPLELNLREKWM